MFKQIKKILTYSPNDIISYFFFNLNYIFIKSLDSYMLSSDIKNVLDGFYLRFFGSKIMSI